MERALRCSGIIISVFPPVGCWSEVLRPYGVAAGCSIRVAWLAGRVGRAVGVTAPLLRVRALIAAGPRILPAITVSISISRLLRELVDTEW